MSPIYCVLIHDIRLNKKISNSVNFFHPELLNDFSRKTVIIRKHSGISFQIEPEKFRAVQTEILVVSYVNLQMQIEALECKDLSLLSP
jgi:hypothetical protein